MGCLACNQIKTMIYCLFDSSLELVAAGLNLQSGTQPPAEEVVYSVPTSGTYYLAVKNYSATANNRFEIFSFYHDLNPYVVSSSLLSPSDAAGVMAVAAINYTNWTTGPQESFSSQGPTTDGRMKPEVSGPDGVSGFVYGSFLGTSASSPHVAGAAALILSNGPDLTVSQLWNAITSSAIDMGLPGQDTIYGYGRLNLSTIDVSPTSVDFGGVLVGTATEGVTTIRNVGNQNLIIGTIASLSAPYQIALDNCSGKSLALGATCTITTRFSPTGIGTFSSSLNIPSNDPYRNPVTVSLKGDGIFEITLSSPSNGETFDACSLYFSPNFWWSVTMSFSSYEVQFSADSSFAAIPVKIQVRGGDTQKTITPSQWKKVLQISGPNGGLVYWRVIGTQPDGSNLVSDVRSILVSEPQAVDNPNLSPVSKSQLPKLTWQNNCNVKFKVWFGSEAEPFRKKSLSFHVSDPNLEGGSFSKELTSGQWTAVRRLVRDVSGSTIYWYVESWDNLNRHSVSGDMLFDLGD